jgi:hypothetical protein
MQPAGRSRPNAFLHSEVQQPVWMDRSGMQTTREVEIVCERAHESVQIRARIRVRSSYAHTHH